MIEAGLPNITGGISHAFISNDGNSVGALNRISDSNNFDVRASASGSTHGYNTIDFNASHSSSIYGNSTTIQPLSVSCYLEFYLN